MSMSESMTAVPSETTSFPDAHKHAPRTTKGSMSVKLSVVVPSLNSGRFIRHALSSVLAQESVDLEVIVQDGGSSDETREIIRDYGDDRILLVTESDDGQAEALNRAVQRATGEWILWLNADDVLAE